MKYFKKYIVLLIFIGLTSFYLPRAQVVNATPEDLCSSMVISDTTLSSGDTIDITYKATTSDIVTFGLWFYNLDNLDASNNPKPIIFDTAAYNIQQSTQIATSQTKETISFADFDKKDKNWTYYMSKPKRVRVDAYFKKVGSTEWSKYNATCSKTFRVNSVDPTPTPVATCVCNSANACATTCFFDKFPTGVTYSASLSCNLGAALFNTAPTATNKNQWCRNYLRTRGDANGDGKVNMLDYFYYVASTLFGAKLPTSANIDFNGDGVVSSADKAILMKTLKP